MPEIRTTVSITVEQAAKIIEDRYGASQSEAGTESILLVFDGDNASKAKRLVKAIDKIEK
jgi:hypothetical protein